VAEPSYRRIPEEDRFEWLRDRGLTDERVSRALEAAFSQASSVTDFYPTNSRGTLFYHHSVGELCSILCTEAGWSHADKLNQKRLISPDEQVQLIVMTGDQNTGNSESNGPQPNNKKSTATQESVESAQLTLPCIQDFLERVSTRTSGNKDLWILMIHDFEDDFRWEISRPRELSEDGSRVTWGPRHFGPPRNPLPPDDGEDSGDIDIEIKRK